MAGANSNLSTNVTVDATQLRSGLALAQADVKTFGAAVRAAAADIKSSATTTAEQVVALDKASAAYNRAKAEAAQYQAKLSEGSGAARQAAAAINETTSAMHNHGAASEAMVLVHEAMSGRFTKMASSLMILTQRIGGASLAMMGLAGAFGVAAMGAMHLIEYMDKVAAARDAANSAGAAFNPSIPQGDIDNLRRQLVEISGVSTEMSGQVSGSFLRVQGIGVETMKMLAAATKPVASAMGEDFTASAHKMADALDKPTANGRAFLESLRATDAQLKAFDAAVVDVSPLREREIILGRINEVTQAVTNASGTAAHRAEELRSETARSLSALAASPLDQSIATTAEQLDRAAPAAERFSAAVKGLTNEERVSGGGMGWLEQQRTALGEATQAAVEAGRAQGESWKQIAEDRLKTEVDFWKKALATTRDGTKEQESAKRALYQAEENLDMMQVKHEATGAKQALETRIAELSAEQAANHDNFAAVMALEDQKLSLLKAGGAAYSRQYEEELKRREDMTRQHNAQLQRMDLEHITKSQEIDREAFSERRSKLDEEVSDHLITKQTEIADLQAFTEQQFQTERAALQNFIDTNALEVAERAKALDQMSLLEAQHAKQTAALNAQMAAADQKTVQAREREYDQMFSAIGSAGERATTGLLMGTETWQRAELQVAQSVVQSALQMGMKVVEQWAATELAKTFATDSGVAQRVAAEQASGATGLAPILANWLKLEGTKTTVTTAAATNRAAAETSSGFFGAIGAMVSGWFGGEAAKTGATTAGAITRTGIQTGADGEALAAAITSNMAMAMSYAAVGAVAAGSSVAAVPTVGWAMAPGVAAETYGTLSGFAGMASFDVGTPRVPQDMIAQIHAGEMIIPAFEASQLRSGQASLGGGSGDGGGGGDTHVHFNVSAMDGQSVQAFFNAHGPTIAKTVARQQSRNPSTRPNY